MFTTSCMQLRVKKKGRMKTYNPRNLGKSWTYVALKWDFLLRLQSITAKPILLQINTKFSSLRSVKLSVIKHSFSLLIKLDITRKKYCKILVKWALNPLQYLIIRYSIYWYISIHSSQEVTHFGKTSCSSDLEDRARTDQVVRELHETITTMLYLRYSAVSGSPIENAFRCVEIGFVTPVEELVPSLESIAKCLNFCKSSLILETKQDQLPKSC